MKKIEKEKRISKGLLAIVLAATFLITLATVLVLHFTLGSKETPPAQKVPPAALPEEGVANGSLMAYPLMQESKIQKIIVMHGKESFAMTRPDKGGDFILHYDNDPDDGELNFIEFRPNICDIDDDFSYSSLYSIEMDDGFGAVSKLKYLCMALMYPYVEERIDLIPEEKDAQLNAYGLAEGQYETVIFTYLDENGEEKSHEIQIGDKTALETGYYLRVDGRNYVYASYQNQFDYALGGFYSFIKPLVISPGVAEDSVISAYLTTNYTQWVNTIHKNAGEITTNDSRIIVVADTFVPVDRSYKEIIADGYMPSKESKIELDLSKYKNDKTVYQRLINALAGKPIADYSQNKIEFTLLGSGATIDFGEAASLNYEYSVTAIEAILTDDGEISQVGTLVGTSNIVKLAYRLKIGGKEASPNLLHAVVDLSDAAIPDDFEAQVRASYIGELPAPITLSVDYSKNNAHKQTVKYVITELVSVFNKNGVEIPAVTDDCIISYRYKFMINGKLEEKDHLATLDLGTDTSDSGAKIKEALKGKKPSLEKLHIVADEYVEYSEYFKDFIKYSVSKIEYFVTSELVCSFAFWNRSERDPYYGESIYENTMTNKYKLYGLNNTVCQKVVNILTGINEAANSSPLGLSGIETVAVGLTPEVMENYNLYDYTIYFELPRGVYTIENPDPNIVDDYAWYEILGFTLYISEEKDGYRYVASDLYDIVAKIDAEKFVFLKYDFVNFFARREMMLTDIAYMQEASFELHFEDLYGIYNMELRHDEIYWGNDGKRYLYEEDLPEGVGLESAFDEITVVVRPMGECTSNKLYDYVKEHTTKGAVSLTQLYNRLNGNGNQNIFLSYDPLGTSNFKKFLENVYLTGYSGVITESKQAEILAESKMLFRMSYKIESSAYRYVYEFYRYDEGRVMVKLYQANYDASTNTYTPVSTPVSDFYISNFAFRKIVNNFVKLLNVEMIDAEQGYPD